MKEDLYIISVYAPTLEQQIQLRNLVYKLKDANKPVLVVSHSHVPDDIVRMCDYYFYDKDNKIIDAWKTVGNWFWMSGELRMNTYFSLFNYSNYSVPALKTMYHGLLLGKELGYSKAHLMVYDTEIITFGEFKQNSLLLDNYDVVAYNMRSEESPLCAGYLISFNLDSYTYDDLRFDEQKLIDELSASEEGNIAEKSMLHNFILPKNYLMKHLAEINTDTLKLDLSFNSESTYLAKSVIACACVRKDANNEGDQVVFFINNSGGKELNFQIIVNNRSLQTVTAHPYTWRYTFLCGFEDLTNIKFFMDDKLLREMDFVNDIPKEVFFKRSSLWA